MSSDETLTPPASEPSASPVNPPAAAETAVAASPTEATASEPVAAAAGEPAVAIQETATGSVSSEPSAASGDAQRAPVQLNRGSDELKARPEAPVTLADESVPTEHDALLAANQIAMALGGNAEPVDIPASGEVELGDLEAEIEAAMATEATAPAEAAQDMPVEGARMTGTIQSIHGDDVFLDLGSRIPGVLQVRQFEGLDPPEVGKQIQVIVRKVDENQGLITVNMPGGKQRLSGNWDAVEKGQIVDCVVTKTNKGGLEVNIGNMRAFLPASQVDFGFVENTEQYVGQKLQVKITEVNPQKRNLVVSRRQLLIDDRKAAEQGFWETLADGAEFQGRVKTIKDYGAFIDLGAVDGFLHIGQISWSHITHPSEALTEGQEVTVKVTKIERDKKKISLTMKHLTQNPWNTAAERFPQESSVSGRVTRVTDFGAFVELEPGIEGLIHISELDWKRVRRASDVVSEGQTVETKVLQVDPSKKRISLSIKQLTVDPQKAEREAQEKAEEEAEAARPAVQRRPRGELKGGIASPGSGGLFGNPNDFT